MSAASQGEAKSALQEDLTAKRLISFLEANGAAEQRHGGGRRLLDHLVGTYEILRRWEQPSSLQHAALIHSVYGTDAYPQQLVDPVRRDELRSLAGEQAERLAHLFATIPRRPLFAGTYRWAPGLLAASSGRGEQNSSPPATRAELDWLVVLHLANMAEQARAPDGSPGIWLVDLRELAEVVLDSEVAILPAFIARLTGVTGAEESAGGSAYREALMQTDPSARDERLAMALASCPVVAEPCVWLAYQAWRGGELTRATEWAQLARGRRAALGAAWDKRLGYDEWSAVIDRLAEGAGEPGAVAAEDPRALYDEVVQGSRRQPQTRSTDGQGGSARGAERFQQYMGLLADAAAPASRLLYPGLDRRPWWEPTSIPLAVELVSHFQEIREEVLALEPSHFMPESERIPRTGDWDVVFFYERGRRHDEVCDACPTTTRIIEGTDALRTAAGLIYVSRMRPRTHIASHLGPTNLRLRCHLGLKVPDGDCAIRVEDQSRRWSEGGCLVFDDSFEHEAWNQTEEERIVLIVDIWHPGLSAYEVHLLAGLHRYAAGYARRLERYWAVNANARGAESSAS